MSQIFVSLPSPFSYSMMALILQRERLTIFLLYLICQVTSKRPIFCPLFKHLLRTRPVVSGGILHNDDYVN